MASGWTTQYLPSNGTDGDFFRAGPMGCLSCTVDHDLGWHTAEPAGGASCPILMEALLAYPGPGPKQWERNAATRETRCVAWQGPCKCTEGTTYQPPPDEWLADR